MLVKALLVAFWDGLCSLDDGGMQLQIRKPLLAGTITGLILGDLTQGLIIGGTLELMWLGVNSVGAYTPPDITGGAIIGVTVGIISGGGGAAGVAFAVPAATLILQLIVLLQTYLSVHIHRAEAAAVAGDFDKANRWHLYSGILLFFARAIPCFIAVYIGNTVLSDFIAWLPKFIIKCSKWNHPGCRYQYAADNDAEKRYVDVPCGRICFCSISRPACSWRISHRNRFCRYS